MLRGNILAIACLAAVTALGGCIFSPEKSPPKGKDPIVYVANEYPDRVLYNLVLAYANRDSVNYLKLLDYAYEGTSEDLTDGTSVRLFNADERDHIQAFAEATTITKVFFTLGSESSWNRLQSDDPIHPEWAVIQITGSQFLLQIDDNQQGTLLVQDPQDTHVFKFSPTLNATSQTDTLWKLVRWEEIRNP